MVDINPVVALIWLWVAVVVTYAYQRASREIALESRPHVTTIRISDDGITRLLSWQEHDADGRLISMWKAPPQVRRRYGLDH